MDFGCETNPSTAWKGLFRTRSRPCAVVGRLHFWREVNLSGTLKGCYRTRSGQVSVAAGGAG